MKTYTVIAIDPSGNEVDCRENVAEHALMATSEELSQKGALTIRETDSNTGASRYVLVQGKAPPTTAPVVAPPVPAVPPPATSPATPVVKPGDINPIAKARIDQQQAAMRTAGMTGVGHKGTGGDGEQFFANGTEMLAQGKATQAQHAFEHSQLMDFEEAAAQLSSKVVVESREDMNITASQFARELNVKNGKIVMAGFKVTESAMRGLLAARLHSPALSYILGLRDRIAEEYYKGAKADRDAIEQDRMRIAETLRYECLRQPAIAMKCRVRLGVGDIFAVTSLDYKAADAPAVIKQVLPSIPKGTKGSWEYDPISTSWGLRASVFTPTPTDDQAVGEPYLAYLKMESADNGSSSFRGGGGCELIRCVNATMYVAEMETARRRHIGKIMTDIGAMVASGTKAISVLTQAWGINRATEVEIPSGLTIQDAIPGFYGWLLRDRSSELQNILPGRKDEHVKKLAMVFEEQRREQDHITRADLMQGLTKYSQQFSLPVQRTTAAAAGNWLVRMGKLGCDLPEGK